jgi:DJ-1/PfpI family
MSRVSFVIFDGFELLDLAGPFEVFQQANRLSGGYGCEVVSRAAGPVRSDSTLAVHAGYGVHDRDPQGTDTLVVVGGRGVDPARQDAALVGWIGSAGAAPVHQRNRHSPGRLRRTGAGRGRAAGPGPGRRSARVDRPPLWLRHRGNTPAGFP